MPFLALLIIICKPLKLNGDVQYKNGAVYTSLISKLGLVDQSIADEVTRANYEELLLRQRIDNEQIRAQDSEHSIYNSLQTEIVLRSSTDTSLNQALASETLARQTADTTNASNIVIEKNRAEALNFEASLNIMIQRETTRASGVEASSRTDLNTEIADRKTAITEEAKSRSDADIAVGVRIDAEIARSTGAEVSNFQTLEGYTAAEQTLAMIKENSLQTQLNFFVAITYRSYRCKGYG
jgi:hypothetical protein